MKKGGTAQYSGKSILALSCKLNILQNYDQEHLFLSQDIFKGNSHILLWLCGPGPATQQSLSDFQKA